MQLTNSLLTESPEPDLHALAVSAAYVCFFGAVTRSEKYSFSEIAASLEPLVLDRPVSAPNTSASMIESALGFEPYESPMPDERDQNLFLHRYLDSFRRFELRVPDGELKLNLSESITATGDARAFLTLFRSGIASLSLVLPILSSPGSAGERFAALLAPAPLGMPELLALALRHVDGEGAISFGGPVYEPIVRILKSLELAVRDRLSNFAQPKPTEDHFQNLLSRPLPRAEHGIHGQIMCVSEASTVSNALEGGMAADELVETVPRQLASLLTVRESAWRQLSLQHAKQILHENIGTSNRYISVKHSTVLEVRSGREEGHQIQQEMREFGIDPTVLRAFEYALYQEVLLSLGERMAIDAEQRLAAAAEIRTYKDPVAAVLQLLSDSDSELGAHTAQVDSEESSRPLGPQEREMESLLRLRTDFMARVEANWFPDVFAYPQERQLVGTFYEQRALLTSMEQIRTRLQSISNIAGERYDMFFNRRLEALQHRFQELLRRTKLAQEIQLDMTRAAIQSKLTLYLLLGLTVGSAVAAMLQAAELFVPGSPSASDGRQSAIVSAGRILRTTAPWIGGLLLVAVIVVFVLWVVDGLHSARQARNWDRHHVVEQDEQLAGKLRQFLGDLEANVRELTVAQRGMVQHRGQHPSPETQRRLEELTAQITEATADRQAIRAYLRHHSLPDF